MLSSLAITAAAFALGPNGGRILKFINDESMNGEVTQADGKFTIPAVKPGEWLVLQFKDTAKAKAVTARLQYDTTNCDACNAAEWICKCAANKEKKK